MSHPISTECRSILLRVLNVVLVLCSLGALGILIRIVGWPISEVWGDALRTASRWLLGTFVVQEFVRVLLQARPLDYVRRHKLEILLTLLVASEFFLGTTLHTSIGSRISAGDFTLFYLAASQVVLLLLAGMRALRKNTTLAGRRLSPGLIFILSFVFLILVGMLLLKTPNATTHGIAWVDALFMATSAVSVTGLATLDLARDFTFTGQCIILGLVQLGGLGVMTFTYFIAYFLAGGVSLRNRVALQDLLSEDNLGQIGTVLGTVIVFTFGCEIAGAALLYSQLEFNSGGFLGGLFDSTQTGIAPDERLFFSVFHSVTAFCNAGFSTLDGNLSSAKLAGRDGVMVTLMLLVLAGGIGFPVVKNCWQYLAGVVCRWFRLRSAVPPRLTSNTKLVLATTLVVCAIGAIAIYATENFHIGGAPKSAGPHGSLLTALFEAVASRTAGFTSTGGALFPNATAVVIMFLMFVGGGPSSTAGGIKTTTLGVAFLSLRRVVLGRNDIEAFGRRLNDSVAHRALATILLAIGFNVVVVLLLFIFEPTLRPVDLAFEGISAVSTSGMSRGLTEHLHNPAKLVLVGAMFIGRVGVLTLFLALVPHRDPAGYRYPEGNIIIN